PRLVLGQGCGEGLLLAAAIDHQVDGVALLAHLDQLAQLRGQYQALAIEFDQQIVLLQACFSRWTVGGDEGDQESFARLEPHLRRQGLGSLFRSNTEPGHLRAALAFWLPLSNDDSLLLRGWVIGVIVIGFDDNSLLRERRLI